MVSKSEIAVILRIIEKPEVGTPMDFEFFSGLLDQYPDFDLLRKAFVLLGQKLGAKGPNFQKEVDLWNLKNSWINPVKVKKWADESVDIIPIQQKMAFFMEDFRPIHRPKSIFKD